MALYIQPLSATIPETSSFLGYSVFADVSNSRVAVGAPGSTATYGAVFVYDRSGDYYGPGTKVTVSTTNGPAPYFMGTDVALNGNKLYAGAPYISTAKGAVVEYTYSGGSWGFTSLISDPAYAVANSGFGFTFALSGNTSMLVSVTGANAKKGAVVSFNNATPWVSSVVFTSTNVTTNSQFGQAIAINPSNTNNINDEFYVGAPYDNSGRGAVIVFKWLAGLGWVEYQKLSLNGIYNQNTNDHFGSSLASYDDILLVGAKDKYTGPGASGPLYPGAVFVYKRTGANYTLQSVISASDSENNDSFGCAVALSGTSVALIGAKFRNTDTGILYAYDISTPFDPQPRFTQTSLFPAIKSNFGTSLSVLKDLSNGMLVVGAQANAQNNGGSGDRYGQAFALNRLGDIQPTPTPTTTPPPASPTPTPTPQATPRFLAPNWYGLAALDPISFGTGAGNTSGNYPKIPDKSGPGRNYSIIAELGSQAPARGSGYYLNALAFAYYNYCVAPNLNWGGMNSDTAMSEFWQARGISLAFSVTYSSTPCTPTKYHTTSDGTYTVSVANNPMRISNYNITVAGQTFPNIISKNVTGVFDGTYNWSVEDTVTGYIRNGTVVVTYGGGTRSDTISYKTLASNNANPPV